MAVGVQSESNGRPTEPPTDNLPILVFDQKERGARVSYLGFFLIHLRQDTSGIQEIVVACCTIGQNDKVVEGHWPVLIDEVAEIELKPDIYIPLIPHGIVDHALDIRSEHSAVKISILWENIPLDSA